MLSASLNKTYHSFLLCFFFFFFFFGGVVFLCVCLLLGWLIFCLFLCFVLFVCFFCGGFGGGFKKKKVFMGACCLISPFSFAISTIFTFLLLFPFKCQWREVIQ